MKSITKHVRAFTGILLGVMLLSSLNSYASHWRFGQLTWRPNPGVSSTTAEFTLTSAFRWNAFGNPAIGAIISENVGATGLDFGDGTSTGILRFQVISIDPANNWFIGIALQPGSTTKTTIDHTYPNADNSGAPWIASVGSCCRSGGEINNSNGSYRIATQVELNSGNSSPTSSLPAIVNMTQSAGASFLVLASDPDPNTTLTYRLATPAEAGPGFNQPTAGGNALSVDPLSGIVSWNTTAAALNGLYSCQIIIEDRDANTNAVRTITPVDFLIQVVNCQPANTAPSFVAPSPACASNFTIAAGDPLSFVVAAADADAGDNVILNTAGLPTGATMSPSLPISGVNTVSSTFNWNTTQADVGNNYVISFTATDNCGIQTICSYSISVVPCSISASGSITDASCLNANDGAIDLSLSGNFGNATYAWTGPNGFTASTEDISGLPTGTYEVTASGDFGLGCATTASFTVAAEADLDAPGIACPAPITVSNDLGLCEAFVAIPPIAVSDDCDLICNTDGLDEYSTGSIEGQAPLWQPWLPGEESGEVSTEQFLSAPNSLKLRPGDDQLYLLGNQTSGKWEVRYSIYVPNGHTAYTNTQKFEASGIEFQMQLVFRSNGSGILFTDGNGTTFGYPQDSWMEVVQEVDLDADLSKLSINGVTVSTWQYSQNQNGSPGTKSLGAVDFFPVVWPDDPNQTANTTYYVDDVTLCGPASEMSNYIARRYSKSYPVGTTSISPTITDGSGNPATCTFDVNVSDTEAPILLTQDNAVTLDASGMAMITAQDVIKESQWVGYINAFDLPSDGGAIYSFGVEQLADLKSTVDANAGTITLQPNFSKYQSGDPNFVNGAIGNKIVQASTYVEETGLVDQFFVFSGTVLSNTLAPGYDNYAFVRLFDASFNLLYEVRDPLVEGNSFMVAYDFTPASTVYVQYGFTVEGLNANPADEAALGSVVVSAEATLGDNCGPTSASVNPNSFGCEDIGLNTVSVSLTDASGNTTTSTALVEVIGELPSCSIASVPASNVFTGGSPTTLYLGYGAQSTTLQATASGGSSFSYSWSGDLTALNDPAIADPVFTPTSAGTYTYTLTVTNEYGCSSSCDITIEVIDARCGKNGNKVLVCHKGKTICISANAVPAHLGNHAEDYLGPCDDKKAVFYEEDADLNVVAYPSPYTSSFRLEIISDSQDAVDILIHGVSGSLIAAYEDVQPSDLPALGEDFAPGMYIVSIHQNGVSQRIKITKK